MSEQSPISTAGRVFAAQFTRDLAARERAGAAALWPGAKTWEHAFREFGTSVIHAGSPTKAGAKLRSAHARLQPAQKQAACYVNYFQSRKRSGYFGVLTYEVALHPLAHKKEGIVVKHYHSQLTHRGHGYMGGVSMVAFVSWHTLGRMCERSEVDILSANGVVADCGLAGHLLQNSASHKNTEINLATKGDILCTGVLREGKLDNQLYIFFDVLTVLPIDEMPWRKRQQGREVAAAIAKYLKHEYADQDGHTDAVSVLPFHRRDYVSRELNIKDGPK